MAVRLWLGTWLTLSIGIIVFAWVASGADLFFVLFLAPFLCCVVSLPALVILLFAMPPIQDAELTLTIKLLLVILLMLTISVLYGFVMWSLIDSMLSWSMMVSIFFPATGILFGCTLVAACFNYKKLRVYVYAPADELSYDTTDNSSFILQQQKNIQMEKGILHTHILSVVLFLSTWI